MPEYDGGEFSNRYERYVDEITEVTSNEIYEEMKEWLHKDLIPDYDDWRRKRNMELFRRKLVPEKIYPLFHTIIEKSKKYFNNKFIVRVILIDKDRQSDFIAELLPQKRDESIGI